MSRRKRKRQSTPRCSNDTAILRVNELYRIRMQGAKWMDVVQYIRDKVTTKDNSGNVIGDPVWGSQMIESRQITSYLARVKQIISENCAGEREEIRKEQVAMRQDMYAEARQQADLRTALACANSEASLQGVDPAQQLIQKLRDELAETREMLRALAAAKRSEEPEAASPGPATQDRPQPPVPPLPE